jgi:hypothetical protein
MLLLIPSEPWEIISMDFMTQPPKWNRMDAILVIVDQFSKLVKMVPPKTNHTMNAWIDGLFGLSHL